MYGYRFRTVNDEKARQSRPTASGLHSHIQDKMPMDIARPSDSHVTDCIEPTQLLSWRRFDLGIKLAYLALQDKSPDFAKKIYTSHIHAFSLGTFKEPGSPEKCSIEAYLNDFRSISDSIFKEGFLSDLGTVPLSRNGIILNGSHRVASSIFHCRKIATTTTTQNPPTYDWKYFQRRGLCANYLDFSATTLVSRMSNARIALLWPKSRRHHQTITARFSRIIYEKDVKLSSRGLHHLLSVIYKNDEWVGKIEDGYPGVYGKLKKVRNRINSMVRVIAFEEDSPEETLAMKSQIRLSLPFGKNSIHISDTHEETIAVSNALFNKNSVEFLNTSLPYHICGVSEKISELKEYAQRNSIDANDFVVDGSFVMERYGLRESKDIDLLCPQNRPPSKNTRTSISCRELKDYFHSRKMEELIHDPKNYFISDGLKYLSIWRIAASKTRRRERKDITDLFLCARAMQIRPLEFAKERLIPVIRLARAIVNSKLPRIIVRIK